MRPVLLGQRRRSTTAGNYEVQEGTESQQGLAEGDGLIPEPNLLSV